MRLPEAWTTRRKNPDCPRVARRKEIRCGFPGRLDRYGRASKRETKCRRGRRRRARDRCPSKGCVRACRRRERSRAPPAAGRGGAFFPSAQPSGLGSRCRRRWPCPDTGRGCCRRTDGARGARRRLRQFRRRAGRSSPGQRPGESPARAERRARDTKDNSRRGGASGGAGRRWNRRARR